MILAAGVAASLLFTFAASADSGLGDVNGDGKITPADVMAIRKYVAEYPDAIHKDNADLNRDGKINGKDVMLLRMLNAELIEVGDLPNASTSATTEKTTDKPTSTTRREWTDRY